MRRSAQFMHRTASSVLLVCLAACGDEVAPPTDTPAAIQRPSAIEDTARTAVAPVAVAPVVAEPQVADPGIESLAARALGGELSATDRATVQAHTGEAVAAVLRCAAAGDVAAQGRAPVVLAQLGAAALPGLEQGLRHEDPMQRRLAVMALLQLGEIARPATASLTAARTDPDLTVRAAAELAWKRPIGDTSDVDRSRAALEAAKQSSR